MRTGAPAQSIPHILFHLNYKEIRSIAIRSEKVGQRTDRREAGNKDRELRNKNNGNREKGLGLEQ